MYQLLLLGSIHFSVLCMAEKNLAASVVNFCTRRKELVKKVVSKLNLVDRDNGIQKHKWTFSLCILQNNRTF